MSLSVRSKPYIIPEYSLTGDLLSYLTCGLQYRYQNKGTLPPSMPIQLWFGEFIHGVMEEAYLQWRDKDLKEFPWDWKTQIRSIEELIDKRLRSRGLYPPSNLFCPYYEEGHQQGFCDDLEHPHKLVASQRAEAAINTWGPHLFPLIDDAEVRLKGIRDMPQYQKGISRSNYYGITGVIDVLSSVNMEVHSSSSNLILKILEEDPIFKKKVESFDSKNYEIIIDYKGMKRPPVNSPSWNHHQWQVLTYSWLRSMQNDSNPVAKGILFYLNELVPFKGDIGDIKADVMSENTDVMPLGEDKNKILKWNSKKDIPELSDNFKIKRSIRLIDMDYESIQHSLREFDNVVEDIEKCTVAEINGAGIQKSWHPRPEKRTCDACDFKTFCNNPEPSSQRFSVP
ncbi:MAG: hypothetical protein CVV28_02865 [Methanobacteriales archaeon HGW-Methanobacteriales-1]|jgi:CRISPR/Cas system-associated exonuclease Cas4 (RecB family)|nr:MAG: hypothetical protein CVV28_02865 [Methanobacteriales archaeon HGW-Methanobacteriales-1]